MRRRSNSHSPISLFTFLDTLVCTMGSLILMLLAMTPKIRERAEARELARLAALAPVAPLAAPVESEPEPEPEAPVAVAPPPAVVVPDPAEEEERRKAERQRRHDAWNRSLAEAREALKSKHAEYQRQRQLLKEAQNELKALNDQILKVRLKTESLTDESQALTERETRLEEQQARIAQKIALTHKNLELLNRQQATAANEFALVPYDGNSGTARRPIYIECSKRGYRFLPEAETLNPHDLEGFREDYNPLLNGAQSLLRYWTMRRRESGGSGPQPYVLLLVRPSGVDNYIIARSFLSSLDANFGYELIEEDWKLSVPAPDPLAKSILKQTLDMTVEAHHKVKDSLAELGQRGTFGSGRGSTPGGWSDRFSPGDEGDDLHGGPPSGKDSPGRRKPSVKFGPALRGPRDPSGLAQPGASDDSAADGSGSTSDSGGATGTGNGTGTGTSRGTGAGGKAVASRPAGIGGGGRSGVAGGGDGTGRPGSEIGDGVPANRDSANSNGVSNGSQRPTAAKPGGTGSGSGTNGSGATGGPDFGTATGISDGSGDGSDSGASTGLSDGGKNGAGKAAGDSNTGGRGGSGGRPGRGGARPATLGGMGAGVGGGSGDGNGDSDESLELPPEYTPGSFPGGSAGSGEFPLRSIPPDPSGAAGQNSNGSGGATSSGTRGSAARGSKTGSSSTGAPSSSAADPAAGDASDSDSASGNSSSGGSPLSPGQMGGPGAAIRLGLPGSRKSSTKDDDPDAGPRIADDDAKASGAKGRANGPRLWGSAHAKASIGLERKLQIRLVADRIMIGWKDISVPVGNGETVEEMINQVVVGIDRAAGRWGEPPTNYYWVPIIRFVIYPGGDQYYERLHGPLERKWGLSSTMEYAPDPKTVKKAAGGSP